MRLFVTGTCGFIGSHLARLLVAQPDVSHVTSFDAITYAGNPRNIADLEGHPKHRLVRGDITDAQAVARVMEDGKFDAILNLAAESHVDRSIESAQPFLLTNVLGTQVLLDAARKFKVKRYVQISTDEVYGSLELGTKDRFTEETPLTPRSPYAASKASADFLVEAAHHTHGLEAIITRCSNNYGPYQFPEKLIPLMTINAMNDKELPVYGDGMNVRDWIWVGDHCTGILAALRKGKPGEVYNFGGENEWHNIDLVKLLLKTVGKPESLIRYVKDRPGHDRRYAIEPKKARRELGWAPSITFEEGLKRTVEWYRSNESWWKEVTSGEYRTYYERHYGNRAGA